MLIILGVSALAGELCNSHASNTARRLPRTDAYFHGTYGRNTAFKALRAGKVNALRGKTFLTLLWSPRASRNFRQPFFHPLACQVGVMLLHDQGTIAEQSSNFIDATVSAQPKIYGRVSEAMR